MNKKITVEVELSDWARFVATDADGEMWEYEEEPCRAPTSWHHINTGKCSHLAKLPPNKNWKDSLIRAEDL